MTKCAIYARVSTKEQAAEGYSIPAQLKAIREFCAREGLSVEAEFVESESAGKLGRTQFAAMCEFFTAHPDVRTVAAHKLDRLTRNYHDIEALDRLGIRARFVISDFPDGAMGVLMRDVLLAFAKNYVVNLSEEVKKGMDEKVAQGGWPHFAPTGYLNDKETASLVVDPANAPFIVHAFERYGTGLVSLSSLASELNAAGFRTTKGNKIGVAALDKLLKNPIYCGRLRYRGRIYPGAHEPLITPELFETVQQAFAPNRTNNNPKKRVYALRDFLYCAECGCKITAGTHKSYVYYRCTNGKGGCSERSYIREELLVEQVSDVLSRIAIDEEILAALIEEAEIAQSQTEERGIVQRAALTRQLEAVNARSAKLLDLLLDGVIEKSVYEEKASGLTSERSTLELKLSEFDLTRSRPSSQVEALARLAQGAHIEFERGDTELRRRTLAAVLCNCTVSEGRIASYQYKDPFGVLEMDSSGAFYQSWWALEDLNL